MTAQADTFARRRRTFKSVISSSGTLLRIVWRDPRHLPERLMLFVVEQQGRAARDWAGNARAQRPDVERATIAAELRHSAVVLARIDGAIAGTPFLIALVPGYVDYLWQEASMVLRIGALYGRDPTELRAAAELLALRGIHPTVDAAEAELLRVREQPLPGEPEKRRPVREWMNSVRMLLVVGGFLGAPDPNRHSRVLAVISAIAFAGVWIVTMIFPVTFMILMAWGCERDARKLGRQAMVFYSGNAAQTDDAISHTARRWDAGHARQLAISLVLFLSVSAPVLFVAHAVSTDAGDTLRVLGAIVAISLVVAMGVFARTR